jgi:hypothetical protein
MRNKLLLIVLLVLLSFSIIAPDPIVEETVIDEFDYAKGDFTKVNWNNIDWNKMDYSNPNFDFSLVPAEFAEKVDAVKAIIAGRGKELTVEQIEVNLEKVESLLDFDEAKAKEAILTKTGVAVHSLGRDAKIKDGILQSKEGSFDFNKKKGWEVTINAKGEILIIKPAEINENAISTEDAFLITAPTDIITKSGKMNVHGLRYFGGKAFVQAGDTAKIGDNIVIAVINDIEVHFEKGEYKGNYVVLTEDSLDIGTTKDGSVRIEPQPGNKLFNMRKKKYTADGFEWVPDERDTLQIIAQGGDEISVQSRAKEGKTPLVKHNHQEGKLLISTGRLAYEVDEEFSVEDQPIAEDGNIKKPIDLSNSVAFELQSGDYTTISTSSNRYSFFEEDVEMSTNRADLRVTTNYDDNAIKTIDDLRHLYPDTIFQKEDVPGYSAVTANMAQAISEWLESDLAAKTYVNKITFNTENNAAANTYLLGALEFGERAIDPLFSNRNPTRGSTSVFRTLQHEFRHAKDIYIEHYEQRDFSGQDMAREGILTKYREIQQELRERLLADREFQEINKELISLSRESGVNVEKAGFMQKITSNKQITKIGSMRVIFKSIGKLELYEKYVKVIRKTTGFYPYAFREYHDLGGLKNAAEVPTVFGEIPEDQVRREIEKGNDIYRRLNQLNYDAGVISEADYKDRMGSYCDNNPCDRCLEYKLTCKSRPEVQFYVE